jgi:probable phosphoglycerate mutase
MESLIYLIRHGEIDNTEPRSFLGWTDPPLNDKGISQALALRKLLQDIPFTGIFSSPLQRAMQTAILVGGILPASVQQVEQFKEINLGTWEGLTVDEVRHRFPGEYEQRGRDMEFFRPESGESFADLAVRSYPVLLSLAKTFIGPLLVVAHAGVNRVLLSRLQQRPLHRLLEIPQDYCAINILSYRSEILQVEAVNLHEITQPFGLRYYKRGMKSGYDDCKQRINENHRSGRTGGGNGTPP